MVGMNTWPVGQDVGAAEGWDEGSSESPEGDALGDELGAWDIVGAAEGAELGDADGVLVGEELG